MTANRVAAPTGTPAGDAFGRAAAELERHGVRWALLRAPGRDGRGTLEVDLLVAPDQVARVERVLGQEGFSRRAAWGRAPHRFLERAVRGPDEGIDVVTLDVVTDLAFGRWHQWSTGLGARCLDRRTAGPVPRLDTPDELLAHLLHAVVDRGTLRRSDTEALTALAGHVRGPGVLAGVLPRPGGGRASWDDLLTVVRDGDWDALLARRPELIAALSRERPRRTSMRAQVRRGLRAAHRRSPLLPGGLVVAVVGPDGTGKSTLAGALVDAVGRPAVCLYGGTHPAGTRRWPAPGLTTAGIAARLLRTRARVTWHRRRGRVVVLDRHPLQVLPTRGDGLPARTRARRRLLAATLAPPDLLIVLDAPVDTLRARRPHHPADALARDRRHHLALATGAPTHRLDTTEPPEVVRARAIALVRERVPGHRSASAA